MENERIRLTREEVEYIQDLNQSLEEITFQIGHLEIRKLEINKEREKLETSLNDLVIRDKNFTKEIFDKYGEGNIDFKTGEFLKIKK